VDLNAIWQVHLWGLTTHCVTSGGGVPEEAEICPSHNMQFQIAAKLLVLCCQVANTNEELGGHRAILLFVDLLWFLL